MHQDVQETSLFTLATDAKGPMAVDAKGLTMHLDMTSATPGGGVSSLCLSSHICFI